MQGYHPMTRYEVAFYAERVQDADEPDAIDHDCSSWHGVKRWCNECEWMLDPAAENTEDAHG